MVKLVNSLYTLLDVKQWPKTWLQTFHGGFPIEDGPYTLGQYVTYCNSQQLYSDVSSACSLAAACMEQCSGLGFAILPADIVEAATDEMHNGSVALCWSTTR